MCNFILIDYDYMTREDWVAERAKREMLYEQIFEQRIELLCDEYPEYVETLGLIANDNADEWQIQLASRFTKNVINIIPRMTNAQRVFFTMKHGDNFRLMASMNRMPAPAFIECRELAVA
jgi:hypothetical protein